jgi:hypothetical protein
VHGVGVPNAKKTIRNRVSETVYCFDSSSTEYTGAATTLFKALDIDDDDDDDGFYLFIALRYIPFG